MLRWSTVRLVVLAALVFALARAVIIHAPNLGPVEWVVSIVLLLVLVAAMIPTPRRTA
jgi:hypothetical protein